MSLNKLNKEYILFTSSNFPSGGAGATFLNLFCKGMHLNGRNVRVYMTKGHAFHINNKKEARERVTPDGVHYSSLGLTVRPQKSMMKGFDDILSLLHLIVLLPVIIRKRKRTTVFVYHMDFFHSLLIYLPFRLFRVKTITFVPEYYNKLQYVGLANRILWYNFIITFNHLITRSDGLMVFSNFLKDIYLKKGIAEEKIYVMPNLTDFEFWKMPDTENKYTLGYSGVPGRKDGLVDLFEAMSILKDEMDVSLLVVGDSTFGRSFIPFLKEECDKLGITDRVRFTGLVEYEEVRTWLSQCKILAITRPRTIQTQAGFPTKLGEYMAMKKSVLATDFGEVESYFVDGKEIVLAKSEDAGSIAEKIKWILQNEKMASDIAENGYNKARELLEYRTSVIKALKFIDNI